VSGDGKALYDQVGLMSARSISFDGALADLAALLQRISVVQLLPDQLEADDPDRERLTQLSTAMSAEQLQLYYQIAILGRRDLPLAPDEFSGFNMTMLRMLAFKPTDETGISNSAGASSINKPAMPSNIRSAIQAASESAATAEPTTTQISTETESVTASSIQQAPTLDSKPVQAEVTATQAPQTPAPNQPVTQSSQIHFDGNWRGLVDQLKLGLARTLAQNSELVSYDEQSIQLKLSDEFKHLLALNYQTKLEEAIQQYFGQKIRLSINVGGTENTPAMQIHEEREAMQSKAESAIQQDGFVKALVSEFDAQVIPSSIKPIQS
jgi:DNA polymerase-3 subunit gamma/tau